MGGTGKELVTASGESEVPEENGEHPRESRSERVWATIDLDRVTANLAVLREAA